MIEASIGVARVAMESWSGRSWPYVQYVPNQLAGVPFKVVSHIYLLSPTKSDDPIS